MQHKCLKNKRDIEMIHELYNDSCSLKLLSTDSVDGTAVEDFEKLSLN